MQPPQDPYSQSPYGQPPYNQSAYPSPYSNVPPQAPRGVVSLEVISEAWGLLMSNVGSWIGATLIYAGILFAISALRGGMTGVVGGRGSTAAALIGLIFSLANFVAGRYLLGGLMKMAVENVRTKVADLNQMWTVSGQLLQLILAAILQAIIGVIVAIPGIAFLVVKVFIPIFSTMASGRFVPGVGRVPLPPGYIGNLLLGVLLVCLLSLPVTALLSMMTPLIVSRNEGAGGALARSWSAMKSNLLPGMGLYFVLGLINFVGALLCCVGLLFTIPLSILSVALVYRDLFGLQGPEVQNTGYAPPPIANPGF